MVGQYLLPILGLCGLFVYALLTLTYNRFYEALGVQPADVGLSYAGTLANSSGFVLYWIYSALSAFLIAFVLGNLILIARHRHWRPADIVSDVTKLWLDLVRRRYLIVVLILGFILIPFTAIPFIGPSPERVKQGLPVVPQEERVLPFSAKRLPLTRFPIFAYPASIRAIQGANGSSAINDLRARPLLYLGQSNGIAVLYDTTEDRSLFLPLSSMVLRVSSCTTTHKCNIPNRLKVACVLRSKSQATAHVSLLKLEDNSFITEPMAITAIRDGDLSLYFEDPAGEVVDLIIGGPANNAHIESVRVDNGSRDLRAIPTCR